MVNISLNSSLVGMVNIDGNGDLTMGTIGMTGFTVAADGATVTKSLDNTNGGITQTKKSRKVATKERGGIT